MNLQLGDTEEIVEGESTGVLGEVLIRCNNVLYIPSAANFITIIHRTSEENKLFCDSLLSYGIIVRNLVAFGLPNCTRITIGNKDENDFLLDVTRKVLDKKLV